MNLNLEDAKVSIILQWNKMHAFLFLIGSLVTLVSHNIVPLLVISMLSFCYYLFRFASLTQMSIFGWANWVTSGRLVLLFVTILFANSLTDLTLAILFTVFISLDGLDGYLARKYDQESDFGKYLDMEADAAYVCLVSTHLYLSGIMPFWILIVANLRYINVIMESLFIKKEHLDARFPFAVYIALGLFVSLILPFCLPTNIYFPILTVSSILVTISFVYVYILNLKN